MTDHSRHTRLQQGFNLIEAAIVLGVLGLVIGGIWVAAASVTESMRIEKASTSTILMVSNARKLMSNNLDAVMQDLGVLGGGEQSIADTMIAAGAVPADLVQNGSLTTPWSGTLDFIVGNWGASQAGNYAVLFWDISTSACIKLVSNISSHFHDRSDLTDIYEHGGGHILNLNTWPVSPADAVTACQTDRADGKMNISLFFSR